MQIYIQTTRVSADVEGNMHFLLFTKNTYFILEREQECRREGLRKREGKSQADSALSAEPSARLELT